MFQMLNISAKAEIILTQKKSLLILQIKLDLFFQIKFDLISIYFVSAAGVGFLATGLSVTSSGKPPIITLSVVFVGIEQII